MFSRGIKGKLKKAIKHRQYIQFTYDTPGTGITTREVVVKRIEPAPTCDFYVFAVYNGKHRKFRSDRIIKVR